LQRQIIERHQFDQALRHAVRTEAFSIVFQPIITVANGRCDTLEVLARWIDPQLGVVSPEQFIPAAERTGEINALGRLMLTQACCEAASWPGPSPPAISVNVSAVQIECGTLPLDVETALARSGLPPSRLYLELTESVFGGNHCDVIPALMKLRQQGIKILLDDFGTGFSCLADLRRLPVDWIKIAKEFVEAIDTDSEAIVRLILMTARTFGLEVVAEGVETVTQAERLIGFGVDYLQGYLLSGGLSPEQTREWIIHQTPAVLQDDLACR
jgi:EAL domain-containing protein (putative c-di-GMP-specific phosphodiesterase class I)